MWISILEACNQVVAWEMGGLFYNDEIGIQKINGYLIGMGKNKTCSQFLNDEIKKYIGFVILGLIYGKKGIRIWDKLEFGNRNMYTGKIQG